MWLEQPRLHGAESLDESEWQSYEDSAAAQAVDVLWNHAEPLDDEPQQEESAQVVDVLWNHAEPQADASEQEDAAQEEEIAPVSISAAGDWIQSANIIVGGKHFAAWFNEDFRPQYNANHPTARIFGRPVGMFRGAVDPANFVDTFNHCDKLYAPQLTLNQFIGLFCIFYNETGGVLRAVSEGYYISGGLDRRLAAAMRYNKKPNIPANQTLYRAGFIANPNDPGWTSTTSYPGPREADLDPQQQALLQAVRECDFYKYRGRGLYQLTWRPYVTRILDPLLAENGYGKSCDQLTEQELTEAIEHDPCIAYGMVKPYFQRPEFLGRQFARVDDEAPGWRSVGQAISGDRSEHGYGELYAWRCATLRAAMNEAGWQAD